MSCRLIPLDKNPGVRPIGIGEVICRIMGKAVTTFLKYDIINSVGPLQLSAGQEGGCEAAVHAMEDLFSSDDCEAVLLVDASNAFNSLNRATSLLNVRKICPEFAIFLINTYRQPAKLYLPGGNYILSNEGTTQGDNCASGFYSISILPIILDLSTIECQQIWYADDAAAGGNLGDIRQWWERLTKIGPDLGYYPNPNKSWLVVKPEHLKEAQKVFQNTGVQITSEGQRYLGAAIGSKEFKEKYVSEKIKEWVSELEHLNDIARSEPQLAYAAYTFGLSKRWLYIMRTLNNIQHIFQPLEDCIKNYFLPTFIKHHFNELDRAIFSLPAKFGGLGIFDPTKICQYEYQYSREATAPLTEAIKLQKTQLTMEEGIELNSKIASAKSIISNQKSLQHQKHLQEIKGSLPEDRAKHLDLLCKKGTSSWLTTLPLKEFGFILNKQEFTDAICLRYNYNIQNMPNHCACGNKNSINHGLICKKGGFVSLRHNIR